MAAVRRQSNVFKCLTESRVAALAGAERYAQPVLRIDNAVAGGDDFTLLKVDQALLDAFLRTAAAQR